MLRGAWGACRMERILPNGPSSHLGSIVHKVFWRANLGQIRDECEFNEVWEEIASKEESLMSDLWFESHLIPLNRTANNYEVKKLSCLNFTRIFFNNMPIYPSGIQTGREGSNHSRFECRLESPDKAVVGYVDAIVPFENGDMIIDYKTGSIFEEQGRADGNIGDPVIKEKYQIQLKLYAGLYYREYGIWPTCLRVMGVDGQSVDIQFSPEECLNLLDEAARMKNHVNSIIGNADLSHTEKIERLASPSPDNCKYCSYRPGCIAYWKERKLSEEDGWPIDVHGKLIEKRLLGNGLILIKIDDCNSPSEIVSVRGLTPSRHPALNYVGNEVFLFSLLPDSLPNKFREGKFTTLYATE